MKITAFFLVLLLTGCASSSDPHYSYRDFPTPNESLNESLDSFSEFEEPGAEMPLSSP